MFGHFTTFCMKWLKVLNSMGFAERVLQFEEVYVTAINLSILRIPIPSSNAQAIMYIIMF